MDAQVNSGEYRNGSRLVSHDCGQKGTEPFCILSVYSEVHGNSSSMHGNWHILAVRYGWRSWGRIAKAHHVPGSLSCCHAFNNLIICMLFMYPLADLFISPGYCATPNESTNKRDAHKRNEGPKEISESYKTVSLLSMSLKAMEKHERSSITSHLTDK